LQAAGSSTTNHTQEEREKRMQNSAQYKDGEFVNPIEAPIMAPAQPGSTSRKDFSFLELIPNLPVNCRSNLFSGMSGKMSPASSHSGFAQ
jgi:hypothetical protein